MELSEGKLFAGLEYQSNITQKGVGFFPKRYEDVIFINLISNNNRCVDVTKNELNKAIKLTEKFVEYVSFRQPRKVKFFSLLNSKLSA